MTSNQVNYARNLEEKRANKAKERENTRSNKARETETHRSNKANERLTGRGQLIRATTDTIGNVAKAAGGIGSLVGAINDPSWYNKDPQLVKDVANISFNTPMGRPIGDEITVANAAGASATEPARIAPGVMALRYFTTPGMTDGSVSDAVNIAARNIYSYVRYANSGASNYEPVDLMMYLLAMDSLYTLYAWGVRTYAILNYASRYSGYYPTALAHAIGLKMGGSADDWTSNLSNVRAFINQFGIKISAFNVPSNFPYFNRHIWMVSNIFKDMDIRRSQVYAFTPSWVFQYQFLGGGLAPVNFTPTPGGETGGLTFKDYQVICEQTLALLNGNEDIGIMSGDILKAYGEANMFRVDTVPESVDLPFVYSDEVLSQIAGASVIPVDYSSTNILQDGKNRIAIGTRKTDTGLLDVEGYYVSWAQAYEFTKTSVLVNMLKDDPTPDDVMVATRLSATYAAESSNKCKLTTYGTEIIVRTDIHTFNGSGKEVSLTATSNYIPASTWDNLTDFLNAVIKFDWAPDYAYIVIQEDTSFAVLRSVHTQDFGNIATIKAENLRNMHYVAVLSEFAVMDVGNKLR